MKLVKLLMLGVGLIVANMAMSQDPVKWRFASKKLSEGKYEVQLTASIQSGWHLYSLAQPDGAIALPTMIQFRKNPLIRLQGNPIEKGQLKKVKEEVLGTEAWQFAGEVSFVQVVELKNKAKTTVAGSVAFQACTDEKCLPPKTIEFSIALTE
jgi:hypothetical protein